MSYELYELRALQAMSFTSYELYELRALQATGFTSYYLYKLQALQATSFTRYKYKLYKIRCKPYKLQALL